MRADIGGEYVNCFGGVPWGCDVSGILRICLLKWDLGDPSVMESCRGGWCGGCVWGVCVDGGEDQAMISFEEPVRDLVVNAT